MPDLAGFNISHEVCIPITRPCGTGTGTPAVPVLEPTESLIIGLNVQDLCPGTENVDVVLQYNIGLRPGQLPGDIQQIRITDLISIAPSKVSVDPNYVEVKFLVTTHRRGRPYPGEEKFFRVVLTASSPFAIAQGAFDIHWPA